MRHTRVCYSTKASVWHRDGDKFWWADRLVASHTLADEVTPITNKEHVGGDPPWPALTAVSEDDWLSSAYGVSIIPPDMTSIPRGTLSTGRVPTETRRDQPDLSSSTVEGTARWTVVLIGANLLPDHTPWSWYL
ncbi:unnamed protein product [Soboliphyme baturini]|uniref:Uncharacterized protein n=1 Tax=Soboliphyme baturini TaxID=241478 RepID=A0A183IP19_9BILA|nr:unnamed protein product [Soboliphyme baturini]